MLEFIAFYGAEKEKNTCTVLAIQTNKKALFQFVGDAVRAQVHCLRIFKDSVVLVPPYIPGRRHPPRVMWNHYIKVKKNGP